MRFVPVMLRRSSLTFNHLAPFGTGTSIHPKHGNLSTTSSLYTIPTSKFSMSYCQISIPTDRLNIFSLPVTDVLPTLHSDYSPKWQTNACRLQYIAATQIAVGPFILTSESMFGLLEHPMVSDCLLKTSYPLNMRRCVSVRSVYPPS